MACADAQEEKAKPQQTLIGERLLPADYAFAVNKRTHSQNGVDRGYPLLAQTIRDRPCRLFAFNVAIRMQVPLYPSQQSQSVMRGRRPLSRFSVWLIPNRRFVAAALDVRERTTRCPHSKVKLPFQSTHVSNHGVHVLRRETMPEPGLIDLDRRHHAAALSDLLSQLRVRLALHLC
jgi:hypothetical protein